MSGSVQTRAQGEIFRKHLGQAHGKKHRDADPEPRRVMDALTVTPWGVRLGAVRGHLSSFEPVPLLVAFVRIRWLVSRRLYDRPNPKSGSARRIRHRCALIWGEPSSRQVTVLSGVSRFRLFIGVPLRGIEPVSKADVSRREGPGACDVGRLRNARASCRRSGQTDWTNR